MAHSRSNRRGSTRAAVRWAATWTVRDENSRRFEDDGELCDVSADGAFLRPFCLTTHPLFPGTRIHLEFPSPWRSGSIAVTGTVRWTGLHRAHGCGGVGIELDAYDPELDRFLKQRR